MKRFFEHADAADRVRPRMARSSGPYRFVRLRWRVLFRVIDFLGWFLVRAGRAVRRTFAPAQPEMGTKETICSVLLVQLDHLGDALLTAAVLPDLRRHFPQARIEVLAAEWNREVFECCGAVDEVHVSRCNRFARRFHGGWMLATLWWGWRLRRRQFDLAIDMRGEFPLALILWLCGARRRLGWDAGGGGFLLTDRAHYVPGRAEIESRLALLALIGVEAGSAVRARLPWFVAGSAARRRMADRIANLGRPEQRLFVLHVGAGTRAKRWPAEHFAELLCRIVVELDGRIVLIGGADEIAVARSVTGELKWPHIADFTGRLTLREAAAVIELADVFVGADSGPAHLAASVGTPAVVLFSGTNHVNEWRPWGERVKVVKHHVPCSPCHRQNCPWSDHPCMRRIGPVEVVDAINSLLGEIESPKSEVEAARRTSDSRVGYSMSDLVPSAAPTERSPA